MHAARRGSFASRRGRGPRGRGGRARGAARPRQGRPHQGRGRLHSNRQTHVVPPASFTRSSVGRETETITVKTSYTSSQVEVYDEVMAAWSTKTKTSKNCVTRTYVNKSGMAADVSGETPVAATSKRTITHVTGVRVQGHSTLASVILAGGKKIYSATAATQRNVNPKTVSSRHQVSIYHTPVLHLPGKADLVNQKGYKLVKQTITGLGTLEFDYGHVGDFMTSVSSHDASTGNVCSIDFSANLHSVPNPGYAPDSASPGAVVSPPDFVFIRSKDPTLLLQGFNESSEETTLIIRAPKELELFSLHDDKYLAKTDVVNILPQPALDGIYRLPQPVRISKSTNIIASLTLAAYFNNPLDFSENKPMLYMFENLLDYFENANVGTVSKSILNIPSGTVMLPRQQVAPFGGSVTNDKGEKYTRGDRYMVIDLDMGMFQPPDKGKGETGSEESDSEISIIESMKSVRIDTAGVPKTKPRHRR